MKAFLELIAKDIYENYGTHLSRLCIVFPNKRSIVYFRKHLASIAKSNIWSPDLFTINTFCQKVTGLHLADQTRLTFLLYACFRKIAKQKKTELAHLEKIDAFFSIAQTLLNDFNDIDNYLADAKDVFQTVKDLKEIEQIFDVYTAEQKEIIRNFWSSVFTDNESREKDKFVNLWNILPELYESLKKNLFDSRIAYDGMIFRHLAENIDDFTSQFNKYKHIVFVGFNAINPAQLRLFKYLKQAQKALFYWNTDAYYMNNTQQESGTFLREHVKTFGNELDEALLANFEKPKNIELIGVPQQIAQAKLIREILRKDEYKNASSELAIVLCDENLLFPLLYSLPENVENINITMGYPLKDSQLFQFIFRYFDYQKSIQTKSQIHARVVLGLLKHSELQKHSPDSVKSIENEILKSNSIYIDYADLHSTDVFFNLVFEKASDFFHLSANLMNILFAMFQKYDAENQNIEKEFLFHVYVSVKKINELVSFFQKQFTINVDVGINLIISILKELRIPFESSGEASIQIMGLMESRNLDFENVILLSVNEGFVPKSSNTPSMIPQSLRFVFALPQIQQQDAVFAYVFFSLLQRTENLTMLYNTIIEGANSGEISRFVQQIASESKHEIKRRFLHEHFALKQSETIVIKKTPDIVEILHSFTEQNTAKKKRSLSASAINIYLDCTLRFYFQYIAEITEPEKIDEEINPALFGSLFHNVLDKLYKDLLAQKNSKIIEKKDIEIYEKKIDEFIELVFKQNFAEKNQAKEYIFVGYQNIIRQVIRKYVGYILKYDKSITPFRVLSLEKKYEVYFPLSIDKKKVNIRLKGFIDRIDFVDNQYRIIDYKTGKAEKIFSSIDELFNRELNDRKKSIMQLFVYLYFAQSKNPNIQTNLGIYDIKNIFSENFDPYIYFKANRELTRCKPADNAMFLQEFLSNFEDVLMEIFNKNIPFSQTKNLAYCQLCPYNAICGK
ncbi:MAG: hypothetical protein CSA05_01305 [Bacteroidia bacterium]|nr:MAG: hypothetical protein CSA05_01305 [Bacteroidia bacterium]